MKSKIIKITAFLLLVIVGCFITSYFSNREKVKADTPSLYYFDIDTSHENYISIILYVLDVTNLQEDTCNIYLYSSSFTPPYSTASYVRNIQFSRYSQLDHDDYNAYIYNYQYPNITNAKPILFYIITDNVIGFDNGVKVSYDLFIPYYPTFKTYFEEGKQEGITIGENNMTHYWRDEYFAPDGDGYTQIYGEGEAYGYGKGYREGQNDIDTTDWVQMVATDVGSILDIKLMPFITIGGLIFIPLMFLILSAVLWIWRRK